VDDASGSTALTVGTRIRDLYPAKNANRVAKRIDDRFLRALVVQATAGFGGKVSLAPRLFLGELIDVMDRVDIHEDYDPATHYRLELEDGKLTPEELAAKHVGCRNPKVSWPRFCPGFWTPSSAFKQGRPEPRLRLAMGRQVARQLATGNTGIRTRTPERRTSGNKTAL
jgi:hypothetical protein